MNIANVIKLYLFAVLVFGFSGILISLMFFLSNDYFSFDWWLMILSTVTNLGMVAISLFLWRRTK